MTRIDPAPSAVQERLWPLWRAIARRNPTWRLIVWESFASVGMMGNDMILRIKDSELYRRVAAIVDGQPVAVLAQLSEMAELNVKRLETAFRFVAAIMVTLPIGAYLVVRQAAPDAAAWLTSEANRLESIAITLAIYALLAALFYAGVWRGRQIAAALTLLTIERGGQAAVDAADNDDAGPLDTIPA